MKKNVKIALGVAAVAVIGYAYWMYLDTDGDDEYFDNDYDDSEEESQGRQCNEYQYASSNANGSLNFILQGSSLDSDYITIGKTCCEELGHYWGALENKTKRCYNMGYAENWLVENKE